MSNIPNRAEYGNLSCLWGVFKSRFLKPGDILNISELKYSPKYGVNSVDICPGKASFQEHISSKLGRRYYCPYLENRVDPRICQWVHSATHDPQKSKPVGQAAIILESMGLADFLDSTDGRVRKIRWTKEANDVSKYHWESLQLNDYFNKSIEGYGPIISLIYNVSSLPKDSFEPNVLYDTMKIIPSGESVNTSCSRGTTTVVQTWDGNTSNDAVTRSVASLLSLAASAGFVKPDNYPTEKSLTPSTYSDWLNDRAKSSINAFPRKWNKEKVRITNFVTGPKILRKGVSYDNFIPKSTDRNRGNKCSCCDENVLNNARTQFGRKSKNRKLLLIGALNKAFQTKKALDLKRLSEISLSDNEFYISKSSQYQTLLNVERYNVSLYGCVNTLENGFLIPQIDCPISVFGPINASLASRVEALLRDASLFIG